MNRIFYLRSLISLSLCAFFFACKPAADTQDAKPAETKTGESTNAEGGLKIEPETQTKMGLKVEAVNESIFTPETKCFGHVIDPSPLNAAINDIALAKATLTLSQKEFDRVKILREQKNASDRALQTAEATFERDRLTAFAATHKLQFTWGKEISDRNDLTEVARKLAAGDYSLVRIDFSVDERPPAIPPHLRISLSSSEEAFDADYLGHAPAIDLPTQGHGLFFLANVGNDKLPISSTITAKLQTGAAALKGFAIPADAVIIHDGEKWFYLQAGESQFHREPLENALSTATGYFVTNGVEAGARIVTTGAQQLLSEELKSQIKPD